MGKALGIANGAGSNAFHPNEVISRQDMIVLTARALQLADQSNPPRAAEAWVNSRIMDWSMITRPQVSFNLWKPGLFKALADSSIRTG